MIKTAEFVVSNSDVNKCPETTLPEYAFIGRSNVGKSSLINALTNRKKLAKTSGRPGKTQLINHFLINKEWFLVDLPGYGYAKVSKGTKKKFQSFITKYFEKRLQLISAFVLVDIRHEPQKIDMEFMAWLAEKQLPFSIVFTKGDKLKLKAREVKVEAYLQEMRKTWVELPNYFITSSTTGEGTEDLLQFINDTNDEIDRLKKDQHL